jgi:single stranded DNA-binding protein
MRTIIVSGQQISNLEIRKVGKGKTASEYGIFQLEMPSPSPENDQVDGYIFEVVVPSSLLDKAKDILTETKDGEFVPEDTKNAFTFFIVEGTLNANKTTVDGRNITEYSIRLSRLTACTPDLNINRVTLAGRLGGDPEYRTFESGSQKCHFSLAIDAGKDGNNNKLTQWFNRVTFWGKQAETISTYVKKGDQLVIQGYFRPSHFESANGDQVDMLEFYCNEFSFGAKGKTNGTATHSDADTHPALVGADEEIPGDWG